MVISLPLGVSVSKTKKFYCNLNIYRNAHFHVLNNAKVEFKEQIEDSVTKLPIYKRVHLIYTLYPGTKRLVDVSNVCSVVDKFFQDTLVELGRLEDDNYNFVPLVTYQFGSIDKANPRVDVQIKELGENDESLSDSIGHI